MKIFDRKYRPASSNFQETDLFFCQNRDAGLQQEKRLEKGFKSFLIFCCGVIFGAQKSRWCAKALSKSFH